MRGLPGVILSVALAMPATMTLASTTGSPQDSRISDMTVQQANPTVDVPRTTKDTKKTTKKSAKNPGAQKPKSTRKGTESKDTGPAK